MRTSLRRISEESGYSLATVSNVMNGKGSVSNKTKSKILAVASSLGYWSEKRNTKVKLVLYKKHGKIADETPFFFSLIRGTEDTCKIHNFSFEMKTLDEESDDFDKDLDDLLHDYTSNVLLVGTEMTKMDLKKFSNTLFPIIILDNRFDNTGFTTISNENVQSTMRIVKLLHSYGMKSISFVQSKILTQNFMERQRGYEQELVILNMYDRINIINVSPSMQGAYEDMKQLIQNKKLKLPEALVVVDDLISFGVLKALQEVGYKVPEDISVFGFDDLPYGQVCNPSLSTVRVCKEELGTIGVNMFASKLYNHNVAVHCELETTLIIRDSIAKKVL